MVLRLHVVVVTVLLGATGCTRTVTTTAAAPTSSTTPISTSTFSPTAATTAAQLHTKHEETVIVFPDLGSVSWTCRGEAGQPPTFRTTFRAMNATEKVSYSLDGIPPGPPTTLQPGQQLSTPFTEQTHHQWRVEQSIEPYVSTATISIDLRPDPAVACFNPKVTVSRVRVSNSQA
jgi:hypothetical protein